MKRVLRSISFGLALTAAVLAVADVQVGAAGGRVTPRRAERLDLELRAVLADSAPEPQRVIIRVRPGSRTTFRKSLIAHGDQILGEHESIDGLTALIHGEDLAALADNDAILSVSVDAVVRPTGLLGGLLGGVLKLAVGLVNTVVSLVGTVLLPNGADTAGPVVAPEVLRQTLGVDDTSWTGRGIGVAVIDSGLEMSAEFQNRVTAFYDFTNGGTVAKTPLDDYGHGTHIAGTIGRWACSRRTRRIAASRRR